MGGFIKGGIFSVLDQARPRPPVIDGTKLYLKSLWWYVKAGILRVEA